jgi:integrase
MQAQRYMKQDGRTQNWVYRRQFPKDVDEIEGSRTYVRSMATSDLTVANRKWSTYDAEYEAKVAQARSLSIFRDSKDARREKFWLSVARWIEYERTQHGGQLPTFPSVPTINRRTSHPFVKIRSMFLAWAAEHDRDAHAVYHMGDIRLDSLFECGLVGSFFTAVEAQKIAIGSRPATPNGVGTTLTQVLEKFRTEKKRNVKTYKDIENAIEVFASACGGEAPTVEGTAREHMKKFRSYLAKREDWKGRTKNKVRANLSSLYGHARTLFLIETNPVEAVATFDQNDSAKRKPFSDADLKTIFESDAFKSSDEILYWLPLLSLYTAARQGELGQLDRSDVAQDADTGLWAISITNKGEDQNTKTELSRRLIPVPAAILKLGFAEFVQSVKSGPLFKIKRSPSGGFPNLSNDLNDMIRSTGIADSHKVFHSFRHTTRTKARTFDIPEEAMDFIAGHASANVGRRYGTHELPLLKRLIDQIQYTMRVPKWNEKVIQKLAGGQ